jgi:hypothetical protein
VEVADSAALAALALPADCGVWARIAQAAPVREADLPAGLVTLVATQAAHLEAWLADQSGLPERVDVEVHLSRDTAPWLLAHRERLGELLGRVRIHQPSYEHLKESTAHDVRDPAAFFRDLDLRVRVSGLPACLAPGTVLVEATRRLDRTLFDGATGRLSVRAMAGYHVAEEYRAKSLRCATCKVDGRCDGIHINMVRDQGLRLAQPLVEGAWAEEAARQLGSRARLLRVRDGVPPQPVAASLPGYPEAKDWPEDPVMQAARQVIQLRIDRRKLLDAPTPEAG